MSEFKKYFERSLNEERLDESPSGDLLYQDFDHKNNFEVIINKNVEDLVTPKSFTNLGKNKDDYIESFKGAEKLKDKLEKRVGKNITKAWKEFAKVYTTSIKDAEKELTSFLKTAYVFTDDDY